MDKVEYGYFSLLRKPLGVATLLPLFLHVLPSEAVGQSSIDVEPSCAGCVISQSLQTRLGASSDPDALVYGTPIHLVELNDGALVLFTSAGGPPTVYDSGGAFLRKIGRKGQGPLEFLLPSLALEVPGDSLLVLDPGQDRALVVAGNSGSRTISRLPSVLQMDVLRWPLAISVAHIRTPEAVARPFHVLDFSGSAVVKTASFGSDDTEQRAWSPPEKWSVDAQDDSLFWAVGGSDYSLELWNVKRGRMVQLHRPLSEYDPENRFGVGNPRTPPPAKVVSALVDDEGLIWVLLHVPRGDWQRAWQDVPISPRGEISLSRVPQMPLDLYQTRVDVIDPEAGALVHSLLIPRFAIPFSHRRSPAMAIYRLDEQGNPLVEIWSLELEWPHSR